MQDRRLRQQIILVVVDILDTVATPCKDRRATETVGTEKQRPPGGAEGGVGEKVSGGARWLQVYIPETEASSAQV